MPYASGKGGPMIAGNKSITAPPRPQPNKCLVVAGVDPDRTMDEFTSAINAESKRLGGNDIDFKHIELISDKESKYMTVAIELNDEDFAKLSDVNFWDPQLRIKRFLGWRWWKGEKKKTPKSTPEQRRNAVRHQWAPSGGTV